VKYVSKLDVKVYLINRSLKKSFSSLVFDGDKYYQIESGLTTEHRYPLKVRFLFPGSVKLMQEILNRVVSVLTSSLLSEVFFSQFIDPYLIIKLFFVCKKEKIDIIQFESPVAGLSCFVVKKLLRIPLVLDSHNVETKRLQTWQKLAPLILPQ